MHFDVSSQPRAVCLSLPLPTPPVPTLDQLGRRSGSAATRTTKDSRPGSLASKPKAWTFVSKKRGPQPPLPTVTEEDGEPQGSWGLGDSGAPRGPASQHSEGRRDRREALSRSGSLRQPAGPPALRVGAGGNHFSAPFSASGTRGLHGGSGLSDSLKAPARHPQLGELPTQVSFTAIPRAPPPGSRAREIGRGLAPRRPAGQ